MSDPELARLPARWRGEGFWACLEISSGSPAGLGASLWVCLEKISGSSLPVDDTRDTALVEPDASSAERAFDL